MCGIVGEYLYNKRFKDSKHIELMLSKIKSRGPDYSGFSTNDSISLGHSRLSIIDLSNLGIILFLNLKFFKF